MLRRVAPLALLLVVFAAGFLGSPEDSYWLNSSPLWRRGDPFFDAAEERFVADPALIWRGRPSHAGSSEYAFGGVTNEYRHNSLGFRSGEVEMPKPSGVTRILMVGDSATWGLNLASADESYPSQLERLLAPRGHFEVVNGGTIGYSTLQGVRFLQRWLDELDPDVVTILLGNNDFQAAGAQDVERSPDEPSRISIWLSHNVFALLVRKGMLALRSEDFDRRATDFEAMMTEQRAEYGAAKSTYFAELARVTPEQHGEHLREMVGLCRARGVRVVLLKVPVNWVWPLLARPALSTAFPREACWSAVYVPRGYLSRPDPEQLASGAPLASHPHLRIVGTARIRKGLERAGVPCDACLARLRCDVDDAGVPFQKRVIAAHNLGVWSLAGGDLVDAAARFERALELARAENSGVLAATVANVHYGLGVCRLARGEREAALASFVAARTAFPFAMCPDYEAQFDCVVRELDVEWIDLPRLFEEADPELWGSSLFHDWVHPDPRGNRVIATAIAERLASR